MGLSFITFVLYFSSLYVHFSYVNSRSLNDISSAPSLAPTAAITPNVQSCTSKVFNVRSFGAIGDGVTDDTQGFRMAWDSACDSDEPATLLVPEHYTFLIRSIIFTGSCGNGMVFQIEGTITAPDGPRVWPKGTSKRQWLVFYRVNGLSLQGDGVIDGRGEKWWDLPCKPHKGPHRTTLPGPCDSPVAIRFFMSTNVTVIGLNVNNSSQFNIRFDGCHGVYVDSLTINAPSLSPNTDGIHIENTNDVKIYNTVISNGDDCVSIGAGSYNIDIKNITCGPGHGISIGSLGMRNTRACVSNITIRDSVIMHSDNGVRIKTWQGGFGSVSKVRFINIQMDTVRNPIMIDQYYCQIKGRCPNRTSAVRIHDISYQKIMGTYDYRSAPIHLGCSDSVPCTNLTFSDVELWPSQGRNMLNPFCWNAYGDLQTLTIPPVFCLLDGNPGLFPQKTDLNHC
ncbi:pectin lyase-like superfamily protein [Artemisia annua]|uniref:Pectin lyase-like superfamily protein n=1 Tax=Artemisia annua TaxID=35608 RepID=A0A2U1M732_ARTAN|nr:pectin lyase-like superfamily protein [Artemisia annua]